MTEDDHAWTAFTRWLSRPEVGPVRRGHAGAPHRRLARGAARAAAGTAVDLGRPRHRGPLQPACTRAVPGARRNLSRLPPFSCEGARAGARLDRGARLSRLLW